MKVKPGSGEVGVSNITNPWRSSLQAAPRPKEIGCPILVHTPIWGKEEPDPDVLEREARTCRRWR
jgi:hypothetical protein